jgi:LysR family transcriptional regulator, hydrogen peroxide-inducible genes activator
MKHLPSLKQLEYLVALAETQHFGKASQRCNVTHSTLSAGIKELESVLGVSLAERTKRKVTMEPLGVEIAERATLLLRDAEDIMELAATHREPLTGKIRLGVIPTIGPFLLPGVLMPLNSTYPDLRLYLKEDQTDALLQQLRAGEIDLALIALPFETDGLTTTDLFEDEFQFACHADHPLAKRNVVSEKYLVDQPLLLLEDGHCLRDHALSACRIPEERFRPLFEATSIHTLVQMVMSGLGVTLLPQLAIDANITAGSNIKLVSLSTKASRMIGMVWRQSSTRVHEFELLANAFRKRGSVKKLADTS